MDPVACGLLATTARSIWKAYIDISANDAGADELVPVVYVRSRPGHDKVQDAPQADSPVPRGRRSARVAGERGRAENRTLVPQVFAVAIARQLHVLRMRSRETATSEAWLQLKVFFCEVPSPIAWPWCMGPLVHALGTFRPLELHKSCWPFG